ncbi:baseplate J/gp47 family protein [Azorhizobium doebereinerae]|uniref:baseplate J/gp47 family protein n=1 Tax=Azorhizobium doebereinerae TaxID=281091 RepID=UPI0018DB1F13|nr:baseplate J/gp47 family protein [Azorhizobium doebereinerae]
MLRIRPDADPAALSRAIRSPRGMLATILRVVALELHQVHLHLRWWGDQYFVDTADVEYLLRHADIWGIQQRPATKAIGRATVAGRADTVVPLGAVLQGAGSVTYEVVTAVTIGAAGTASVDVRALAAGTDGNAAAGTRLSFITTVSGLTPQEAAVDADGLAGGAPIETQASLLSRVLAEIREPAHGGAGFDYPRWIQNSFAASHVRCLPNWVGVGTVGVVVAMGSAAIPRVPTPAELDAMAAHLDALRPVTAEVIMVAVELLACDVTVGLDPYEATVRNAATAAATAFFAREARIGERLYHSRLSEAISAASGEYRHELIAPAGDIVPTLRQLPVPGVLTWQAAS